MAGRTPIPVARAMRNVATNLDLARRQQRITLELLAERANVSVPTVRKLLNDGAGTFENFLRIARILGMLEKSSMRRTLFVHRLEGRGRSRTCLSA